MELEKLDFIQNKMQDLLDILFIFNTPREKSFELKDLFVEESLLVECRNKSKAIVKAGSYIKEIYNFKPTDEASKLKKDLYIKISASKSEQSAIFFNIQKHNIDNFIQLFKIAKNKNKILWLLFKKEKYINLDCLAYIIKNKLKLVSEEPSLVFIDYFLNDPEIKNYIQKNKYFMFMQDSNMIFRDCFLNDLKVQNYIFMTKHSCFILNPILLITHSRHPFTKACLEDYKAYPDKEENKQLKISINALFNKYPELLFIYQRNDLVSYFKTQDQTIKNACELIAEIYTDLDHLNNFFNQYPNNIYLQAFAKTNFHKLLKVYGDDFMNYYHIAKKNQQTIKAETKEVFFTMKASTTDIKERIKSEMEKLLFLDTTVNQALKQNVDGDIEYMLAPNKFYTSVINDYPPFQARLTQFLNDKEDPLRETLKEFFINNPLALISKDYQDRPFIKYFNTIIDEPKNQDLKNALLEMLYTDPSKFIHKNYETSKYFQQDSTKITKLINEYLFNNPLTVLNIFYANHSLVRNYLSNNEKAIYDTIDEAVLKNPQLLESGCYRGSYSTKLYKLTSEKYIETIAKYEELAELIKLGMEIDKMEGYTVMNSLKFLK